MKLKSAWDAQRNSQLLLERYEIAFVGNGYKLKTVFILQRETTIKNRK